MSKRKATEQPSTPPPKTKKAANTHTQQQKPFRFLDLPSELRNRVYEHLFEGSTTTIRPEHPFQRRNWTFVHKPANCPNDKRDGLPALLATNRQLRNEAEGIFYACTSRKIRSHEELPILIKMLGPERVAPGAPVAEKVAPVAAAKVETIRYVIGHESSAFRICGYETLENGREEFAKVSLRLLGQVMKSHRLVVRDGVLGVKVEGIDKVWFWPGDGGVERG